MIWAVKIGTLNLGVSIAIYWIRLLLINKQKDICYVSF